MPSLNKYSIVISANASYSELSAAKFLASNISSATGYQPEVYTDDAPARPYEIVVGQTSREISEGVNFERSADNELEFELRFVGTRLFVTGFGIVGEKVSSPFNSYAMLNDGAIGTSLASYRFVEETFGSGFLFPADISMMSNLDASDIEIDSRYDFLFTKALLRAERPEKFSGAAIYSVPSADDLGANSSCLIFKSENGSFAVYNGGSEQNAERLCELLEYLGGNKDEKPRIDAWFISMPSPEYSGALCKISASEKLRERLDIKKICFKLLDDSFYTSGCSGAKSELSIFCSALRAAPFSLGCEFAEADIGNKISAGDFDFEVIWSPTEDILALPKLQINDASALFRATHKKSAQRILLSGNATNLASDYTTKISPEKLACELLVLPNHGRGGVSPDFFRHAAAEKYLYHTTAAKYYGDNGEGFAASADSITRVRGYMSELGVKQNGILKDIWGILSLSIPFDL